MTGGTGLAMGISQGLDKAADGMVRRQQIQQQSAMFNQQMQFSQMSMGMKMQQHQTMQEQSKLMIETMQAKLGEYESQIAKRDAFDAMRAFEYTGDASLLNSANQNPKIKALLASKGIALYDSELFCLLYTVLYLYKAANSIPLSTSTTPSSVNL